jgi:hypothetical protein
METRYKPQSPKEYINAVVTHNPNAAFMNLSASLTLAFAFRLCLFFLLGVAHKFVIVIETNETSSSSRLRGRGTCRTG